MYYIHTYTTRWIHEFKCLSDLKMRPNLKYMSASKIRIAVQAIQKKAHMYACLLSLGASICTALFFVRQLWQLLQIVCLWGQCWERRNVLRWWYIKPIYQAHPSMNAHADDVSNIHHIPCKKCWKYELCICVLTLLNCTQKFPSLKVLRNKSGSDPGGRKNWATMCGHNVAYSEVLSNCWDCPTKGSSGSVKNSLVLRRSCSWTSSKTDLCMLTRFIAVDLL